MLLYLGSDWFFHILGLLWGKMSLLLLWTAANAFRYINQQSVLQPAISFIAGKIYSCTGVIFQGHAVPFITSVDTVSDLIFNTLTMPLSTLKRY